MNTERGSLARASLMMIPVLAGLVASTILLIDYIAPSPVFCDAHSGCAALKKTMFASLLGIPTPTFGVFGFILFGALALLRGPRIRSALLFVAIPASLLALFFIGYQVRVSTYCKYCLTADISTCVLLGMAAWRRFSGWDPPHAAPFLLGFGTGMVVAVAAPSASAYLRHSAATALPSSIEREIARDPKRVTIIDFVDYECPFCRMAQSDLATALERYGDRVRVVRKHVPLAHLHPHAMAAARAACCAQLMGAGEAVSDQLFSTAPDELTEEGCVQIAVSLGLSAKEFQSCVSAPETEARIRADMDEFKSVGGRGLPLMWVGHERLDGYEQGTRLADAIEKALAKRS